MIGIDLSNENIVHVKKDGIEYLQFRKLLEYKDVLAHCFTLKPLDFVSNNTYQNQEELVLENYEKICNSLGVDYKNVIRPYQTHTNNVKEVVDRTGIFLEEYNDIDGLITDQKNKILSLTYADCTPLYFFEPNKKVVANIHSGWIGTTKKIVVQAVEKLVDSYGCDAKELICCLGPTIRECHFEVDEDVKDIFKSVFGYMKNIDDIIVKGKTHDNKQKYYIDTVEINRVMLLEAGLKEQNIIDSGVCSVCNSDKIYSYRGNNKTESRNTALICLK